MLKVKLTTSFPENPIIRQTPNNDGIWGNCKFYINEDVDECDYWFVYEGLKKSETTICSPQNIFFITGEPPEVRDYSKLFLNQFYGVITCHDISNKNLIKNQQALPWHVGLKNNAKSMDYDYLANFNDFSKSHLISVITSNKMITEGHRKRIEFVEKLKTHFGDELHVYGKGFNPVEDKWDAINPYKYHIVIENSSNKDYWTEKLSDCFLANSFPIYYGCTNIEKYFNKKSLLEIDIYKPNESITQIAQLIRNDRFQDRVSYIQKSKEAVLNQYNLFAMIAEIVESEDLLKNKKSKRKVRIRQEYTVPGEKYINYFL